MRHVLRAAFVAVQVLTLASTSWADTRIWASAGGGTWNTAANWIDGVVPSSSDTIAFQGWQPISRSGWSATASATYMTDATTKAFDGNRDTRWSVGSTQSTDDWYRLDMGTNQTFAGIDIDAADDYPTQYPRGYKVEVSTNGSSYTQVATGNGSNQMVEVRFTKTTARYIRITLTQVTSPDWWEISELTVWGTAAGTQYATAGMTPSASATAGGAAVNALDFNNSTVWSPGANQVNGQWFKVDLGTNRTFTAITMDSWSRTTDYPRGYNVEVSTNNSTWSSVATGSPTTPFVLVTFSAQTARYIRVTQTGSAGNWWSMYEFHVYGTPSTCTTSGNVTTTGVALENDTTFVQASGHTLTVNGAWTQTDGTFTGGNSAIDITGNFNLSSTGAFTSTSGRLAVSGAFTNSGTFTHNSGRVVLAATSNKTFATNGQSFHDVIINDGLVGYWKLDEGSSAIADSSEYGHSGTLFNTPSWMAGPTLQFTNSNALVVNGSSQYGRITRSPALEPAAVSVSVWVRRNGAQVNNAKVVSKTLNNNFASPWASYEIHVNNGGTDVTRINWQTGHVGGALNMLNSATNALPNTTWVHVVGVYDPSASAPQKKLYVNGVLSASTTVSTDLLYDATSTGDLYIGMNGGGAQYFNGAADDLRVYGRALSAADVAALYAGDTRVTPAATQTLSGALAATGELVIVSGNLDVSATACSAAPCAVSVGEAWRNLGGLFTPRTGTVSFNGTGGSLLSDRISFYNLTVSGTGTWTLGDRLYVDNALTMSANGTLATATYPIHAGSLTKTTGTISGSGSVVLDAASSKPLTVNNVGVPLRIESPLDNGLVGYWKLDEGRGSTVYDLSGNSYNATIYNDAIWSSSVPTSPAIPIDDAGSLTLDGTDQYARVSRNATLEPTSVTVAAWVKRVGTQVLHAKIVNKTYNNSASAPYQSYALQMSNDADSSKIRWELGLAGATTSGIGSATGALPDGSWVHVVGVYDPAGSAPQQRLYINGTLSASATLTTALSYNAASTGDLYFGQNGGSSQYFAGSIDDVRIYGRGLSANEVAALYSYGYTTGSTVVYTLGAAATMGSTFKIDSGILNASTFQNTIAGAATINGGEYKIGSNTSGQTFTGGLTVNRYGALTLASANGKAIMGNTSSLIMNGTLNASSTGASIQAVTSGRYTFNIGTTSTATPTLNITGLQVKDTTANGMYINSDTGSVTTFTRFDNIAFSNGAGTGAGNYNLRIYATSLNLASNGCTFDNGASKSVEKNVYLVGNGHSGSPDSTPTRIVFGGATCANSSPCESYDGDDDNNATPDGLADNLVNGGSVIQWVQSALADTSGSIEGFPTAAFNWNNFSYYSTYVAYHDTDGDTADTVYVRSASGAAQYSWNTAIGEEIIGTPRWDTVSNVHYLYVAVAGSAGTGGKVYRLIDNGSSLSADTASPWNGGNNPYSCTCTITTPLAQDTNNVYWGGWVAGPTHKLWSLVKTTRTLVGAALNTTYATSNTAPAIWGSSPTSAFLGLAGHIVKFNITTQAMSDDNTNPGSSTPVTGRITIIFNKLYAGDDNGWLWALDPASMVGTAKLWSYRNHASAIKSHYFDPANARVYFGDQDGHIMVVNSTGAAVTGFPYSTGSGAFATAPFYSAGVIIAGTTSGSLYFIDQNSNGSVPAKIQTYEFGTSNAISSIGYDPVTGRYMVSTANATNKDGKLYYFAAVADPTTNFP